MGVPPPPPGDNLQMTCKRRAHASRNQCRGKSNNPNFGEELKLFTVFREKLMDWELACHELLNSLHYWFDLFPSLDPPTKPFFLISISEVFKYPLSETRRSCIIQPYSWR